MNFELKNVQSGFTSDIAEIIIDKLVQMPKLEKVKLTKIKLEDKPRPRKEGVTATSAASKAGGLLRKSLGGLFKEK